VLQGLDEVFALRSGHAARISASVMPSAIIPTTVAGRAARGCTARRPSAWDWP
jgi:hypothetical protein